MTRRGFVKLLAAIFVTALASRSLASIKTIKLGETPSIPMFPTIPFDESGSLTIIGARKNLGMTAYWSDFISRIPKAKKVLYFSFYGEHEAFESELKSRGVSENSVAVIDVSCPMIEDLVHEIMRQCEIKKPDIVILESLKPIRARASMQNSDKIEALGIALKRVSRVKRVPIFSSVTTFKSGQYPDGESGWRDFPSANCINFSHPDYVVSLVQELNGTGLRSFPISKAERSIVTYRS